MRTDAILTARAIRAGVLTDDECRRVAEQALDDMGGGHTIRDRMAAARVLVALRGQDIRQAHYTRSDDRGDRQDHLAALRAMLASPEMAGKLAELLPDQMPQPLPPQAPQEPQQPPQEPLLPPDD